MRRRNTAWALSIAVLAALTLAGCTASGGGSSSDGAGRAIEPGPAPGTAPGTVDAGTVDPALGVPETIEPGATGSDGDDAASADRQIISQGSVSITAKDPIAAADDAALMVERAGGRIDSRDEYPSTGPDDDTPSATLVARIPSSSLTATLAEIVALGELEQRQLTKTDVTTQSQDLDARITALRTSTDRLTALLATAATTKDLIDIESSLSERQGTLESLEAQRRGLADQVDLATVSIVFGSEAAAPLETPDTFISGLVTGWESLVAFTTAVLVAFGVALPWLLVLGVIGAVTLALIRRRRRTAPSPVRMGE